MKPTKAWAIVSGKGKLETTFGPGPGDDGPFSVYRSKREAREAMYDYEQLVPVMIVPIEGIKCD